MKTWRGWWVLCAWVITFFVGVEYLAHVSIPDYYAMQDAHAAMVEWEKYQVPMESVAAPCYPYAISDPENGVIMIGNLCEKVEP